MAHRQLLTDDERPALVGIPLDPDGMARRFTLSRADQNLVAERRRVANRIGFAVQLALLRYPGIALAQLEQPVEPVVQWLSGGASRRTNWCLEWTALTAMLRDAHRLPQTPDPDL